MATREQLERALINADAAGDVEAAKALAAELRRLMVAPEPEPAPDPSAGGSTLQFGPIDTGIPLSEGVTRFLTGTGKGMTDLARGVGQTFGLVDQESIRQAQELDAPLMETGAGAAGNIVGNVAPLVPLAFVPGANSLVGSAALGGLTGLMAPQGEGNVVSGKLQDAAVGSALGPLTILGGRALHSGYNAVRGLVEPFTKPGQEQIVGRTLRHFAANADDAGRAAGASASTVPGYRPTLAEVTQDPGLATLQRAAQGTEAGPLLGAREMENAAAIKQALKELAGDDAAMAAAKEARRAAAAPLYDQAGEAMVKPDDTLMALLNRPSIKKAWARAKALAAENGEKIAVKVGGEGDDVLFSVKGLHYLKMALDDMLDSPQTAGIGKHEARAIASTRDALLNWMDEAIPDYGAARAVYAQQSAPINQMEVGQALYNKVAPALDDFAATPGLRAASYAEAVRNAERTVKNATGMARPLDEVLTPEQMQTVRGVGEALSRRATAQNAGRAVGSNTAQNLAAQNLIRQIAGPFGAPQSFAEARVLPTLMRPVNFALNAQEPAINQVLAEALLDPRFAAALMSRSSRQPVAGLLMEKAAQRALMPGLLGANVAQE